MKKILGLILVFIFCFGISGNVFGDENIKETYSVTIEKESLFYKNLILAKKELEKTNKGKRDINTIDKLMPLVKNKKLINFYDRLSKIDSNNNKLEKHKYLLRYLYAKTGLEIYNRKNIIIGFTNNYNNFYEDSTSITRDLDRNENIISLSTAIEMFFQENGKYPDDIEELQNYYIPYHGNIFPVDPLKGNKNNECSFGYNYEVFDSEYGINQGYTISACLENNKDGNYILKKGTE